MENNYYGVIYKITNLINNKVYIGQTKQKPPIKRFRGHIYDAKRNIKMSISRAIKKYGKENFTFTVLCTCNSSTELNKQEEYFINYYQSNNKKLGYNICSFINGTWKHSKESKKKIKEFKSTKEQKIISSKLGKKLKNTKKKNSSSVYMGISKEKCGWVANYYSNNKKYYGGIFKNEIDAAKARDILAVNVDKEYKLNFPELEDDYINNKVIVNRTTILERKQKYKKSDSNIIGVHYSESRNRWVFERIGYKFKSFKTKEECENHALQEYENK